MQNYSYGHAFLKRKESLKLFLKNYVYISGCKLTVHIQILVKSLKN
jgi:hypothetical protein